VRVSTSFKIRLLLFLLTLSVAVTALTVHYTFHKDDTLNSDANEIEGNLHKKESYVKQFFNNPSDFKKLETIDKNAEFAVQLISDLGNNRSIYLYTYRNNKLVFWGTNRLILETDATLREGSNMIKWENGWYEAVKHSRGNFSAVCFIPIKSNYAYENQYLKNVFEPDLISSNNLEIARLNDSQVYSVRNIDGKYLFSVKLKSSVTNTFYPELILWILVVLFGCILMNTICVWISNKGYTKTAIALFFIFFLFMRIMYLKINWFGSHFGLPIFEPWSDIINFSFPSIGVLFFNVISALWFLAFTYSFRFKIKLSKKPLGRTVSYLIFALLGILVSFTAFQINNIFHDLIIHSNINFDLTNILSLDWLSWLGILIFCFCILNLYLLIEIILIIGLSLNLTNYQRLIIFLTGVGIVFLSKLFLKDLHLIFLLFALIIFLRGWAVYKKNSVFNLSIFILIILVFAIIASVKLSVFQIQKELEQRKMIAKGLESADDPHAVLLFSDLEQKILKDDFIITFFKNKNSDKTVLNNYLQKFYFNDYLSRYNFTIFQYEPQNSFGETSLRTLENYINLVISGSTEVSEYFYKKNNTFGFQIYFSLLPIKLDDQVLGTLFIELKSKSLQDPYSFPPVLINSKAKPDNELVNYSFAYYNDGHLVSQYGDYVYDLINNNFKDKPGNFVFEEKNDFNHLIYQVKEKRHIVVSKPVLNWITHLASVAFLFQLLLIFASIIISIRWFWVMLHDKDFKIYNFSWNYILSKNHILYRTRIQAYMIAAIVITLIIVSSITYLSISYQYRERQKDLVLKQINQIHAGIESQMFQNGILRYDEQLLNAFTSINATELNLYDTDGELLFTTQPKIYNNGLLAGKMDALAYIYLNKYQRSQYINREQIGNMQYISAYTPIRNNLNEIVAYLNLPDFTNEKEFHERIGHFLNTLTNVYALVFVAIIFFAVFLINQITSPLTIVQKSLSETKIGRKNEPIIWDRDDEIGSLIKEYNKMIVALEESAQKFARSERETAWKEMAKQVAHEIKNPLTPLKLGIQLLEKSWKEKDPNFGKKFEKFSKSFVEQIESLSNIASEFSNFAKMPDTLLENVNLREIIEESIEVFQSINRITITLEDHTKSNTLVKGDKDQLLRSFNNLIKNAVEAIPEYLDGKIEIIMKDHQDGQLHVQVIDNGKGIPEGLLERIFNPNFTTKSSGTGLGLAFVKQAIENMLGTIRFETELNKGTTFYITIPLANV